MAFAMETIFGPGKARATPFGWTKQEASNDGGDENSHQPFRVRLKVSP
jgi:hypothetical protein